MPQESPLIPMFPNEEKYALISQMRRAAVSIHSNIAEGSGRNSNLDFSRFLHYSIGSINELESQLIYAFEVNYLDKTLFENFQKEMVELQKMIYSFEEYIKK